MCNDPATPPPAPFVLGAGLDDRHRRRVPGEQAGEVRDPVGREGRAAGEGVDRAGGRTGEAVDADPRELAAGVGDLLTGLADEGELGVLGQQPAEVGDEGLGELERERAGKVPGGERGALTQVDDPLAGRDAGLEACAQLDGPDRLRRRQVDRRGAGGVGGPMRA
jgi:hypothetical protein